MNAEAPSVQRGTHAKEEEEIGPRRGDRLPPILLPAGVSQCFPLTRKYEARVAAYSC